MRDVAALAGVSIKTVSRVVNAEPGVSVDLVARVEAAARQLDYRPDLTASSLRRGARRTATLGLMLEDVSNPYSGAVHRAVDDAASERGVAVCDNGADDDGDGDVDCYDSDCANDDACTAGTEDCNNGADDDGAGALEGLIEDRNLRSRQQVVDLRPQVALRRDTLLPQPAVDPAAV